MTDNRTTELREKLTERGVEYKPTKFSTLQTMFTANGVEWVVTERETTGELFVEPRHGLTPEQAIAATLGVRAERTCRVEDNYYDAMWDAVCWQLSCGHNAWSDEPKFCPECGAKVVKRT